MAASRKMNAVRQSGMEIGSDCIDTPHGLRLYGVTVSMASSSFEWFAKKLPRSGTV